MASKFFFIHAVTIQVIINIIIIILKRMFKVLEVKPAA